MDTLTADQLLNVAYADLHALYGVGSDQLDRVLAEDPYPRRDRWGTGAHAQQGARAMEQMFGGPAPPRTTPPPAGRARLDTVDDTGANP